jgi:F0F1-type ATP synthase membrane subunit b/b'
MIDSLIAILATVSLTPVDGIMIVVCFGLLCLLYKTLEIKVFAPILEHIEERESLTTGAVFSASQMRQKSAALKARFDEALFRARVEGNTKRAEIISNAKSRASAVISQAENEAANELGAGRQEIAKQISAAQTTAEGEAQELAKRLATQVDAQLAQGA